MYYGVLNPWISHLINKYSNMKQSSQFNIKVPLIDTTQNSLNKRFLLDDTFLIIVSISHTFLKHDGVKKQKMNLQ